MAESRMHRRTVLRTAVAGIVIAAPGCAGVTRNAALVHSARPGAPFLVDAFSGAGVFDADWLLEPRYTRLLDTMAASPGAFGTMRFFGALNAGEREAVFPTSSGRVWPALDAPMDFSVPLAALDALVSRGITPFVGLTFFPRAVSTGPVVPPPDGYAAWQRLVRGFLDAVTARFGAAAVGRWWFEAWNEPNMPPFWGGSFDQYLDLYRATSEAVLASGHTIRLGGPALAYLPGEGRPLMERFLAFLHREPKVKCDFVSMHRKGIWVSGEQEPRLDRLEAAARETADALLRLAPERARGMAIVNDEADMKVRFDTPYEPRMTEQFPAWLAASAILHDRLSAEYAGAGIRFVAAADHANQHLVQAPFDGRRSVMTRLSADPADLVKLPVFHFHEMLRLLGDRHGTVLAAERLPAGLFHLVTSSEAGVAALLTYYPDGPAGPVDMDYTLQDLPWRPVNLARFGIGAALSNSYAAAGGTLLPNVTGAARIRAAAELGVADPIRSGVVPDGGALRLRLRLMPFETVLIWVTPTRPLPPAKLSWVQASVEGGNAVLRWTPGRESDLYSYEVRRNGELISPVPLRAAMWVDAAPPGRHTYGVRAVSASGVAGPETSSRMVS
jgi:Glycosyl hydrolases family 39